MTTTPNAQQLTLEPVPPKRYDASRLLVNTDKIMRYLAEQAALRGWTEDLTVTIEGAGAPIRISGTAKTWSGGGHHSIVYAMLKLRGLDVVALTGNRRPLHPRLTVTIQPGSLRSQP